MAGEVTLEIEAAGETVGEAKWLALRELERLQPGLDRAAVVFEVLAEGERGLLGVGTSPARVSARLTASAGAARREESEVARHAREVLGRILDGLGLRAWIEIDEDDESVRATVTGPDLGLLIGRRGQTIDAVQEIVSALVRRRAGDEAMPVAVDAAGYRERREERLESLATRTARAVLASGLAAELEPMTAAERRIVHRRLEDIGGVETRSEGDGPNRRVVIVPAETAGA